MIYKLQVVKYAAENRKRRKRHPLLVLVDLNRSDTEDEEFNGF